MQGLEAASRREDVVARSPHLVGHPHILVGGKIFKDIGDLKALGNPNAGKFVLL